MSRAILLAGAALVALTISAQAAEVPKPCGPDPRERCVAYRLGQIVRVYLAPGATTTIELPASESIFFVGTSDDGIIRGQGPSARTASAATADTTSDPNLMIAVPGGGDHPTQFFTVKALHHLEPQPLLVIGRWTNPVTKQQEFRRHVFDILTRPGDLSPATPDTIYAVHFTDPGADRAVRQAALLAEQQARSAQEAADRLQQAALSGPHVVHNVRYDAQGTAADRTALAPADLGSQDVIWDDGQRTYLRYPGNRHVPVAYKVLPDGTEGVVGQSTVPDPTTNGTLLVIHEVVPMLRLRDGNSVLCIANRGYDPTGSNPGTGTVDPGVVRQDRKEAADVRPQ